MKTMPFPKEYKKILQRNKKNMTIRTHDEVGKYKRNETYQATDYKGNPFNIEIKVLDILRVPYKRIKKHLPKADQKKLNINDDEKVDVIRFVSKSNELIDVRTYGLKTDEGKVLLNKEAAKALAKANKELPAGYEFSIISGYRTKAEQLKLIQDMEKELKKTNPNNWQELLDKYTGGYKELNSENFSFMDHRSGNAVDLEIVFKNKEIDLGGQMNDERDQLDYYEKPELNRAIKYNRRWLKFVLEKHGFKNNPDEWWHWGYKSQ